ncbi:MAG: hypothetical protein HRT36_04130 [Alphaproteobacteria bacterium]|nr:hypothetical protein [Alphaproteobacteria bacterium]
MTQFIIERFGLHHDEAPRVAKKSFLELGTTLRDLMNYHDIAPEAFLSYVHDIDYSSPPESRTGSFSAPIAEVACARAVVEWSELIGGKA